VHYTLTNAFSCLAFTEQQLRGLSEFDTPSPAPSEPASDSENEPTSDNEPGGENEPDEDAFHARGGRFEGYTPCDLAPSPYMQPPTSFPTSSAPHTSFPAQPQAQQQQDTHTDATDADAARMSALAREFGIERELVEALVLRLGSMNV
jgi:hypothetical protein